MVLRVVTGGPPSGEGSKSYVGCGGGGGTSVSRGNRSDGTKGNKFGLWEEEAKEGISTATLSSNPNVAGKKDLFNGDDGLWC